MRDYGIQIISVAKTKYHMLNKGVTPFPNKGAKHMGVKGQLSSHGKCRIL